MARRWTAVPCVRGGVCREVSGGCWRTPLLWSRPLYIVVGRVSGTNCSKCARPRQADLGLDFFLECACWNERGRAILRQAPPVVALRPIVRQHEQEKIFCFSSYAGVAVRRAGQGRFLGRVSAKVEHGLGQEHDGHDVREYAQVDKARLPRLEPALRAQPDGVDEVSQHA